MPNKETMAEMLGLPTEDVPFMDYGCIARVFMSVVKYLDDMRATPQERDAVWKWVKLGNHVDHNPADFKDERGYTLDFLTGIRKVSWLHAMYVEGDKDVDYGDGFDY